MSDPMFPQNLQGLGLSMTPCHAAELCTARTHLQSPCEVRQLWPGQDFDQSICCLPLFDSQKPFTVCPEVLLHFIQFHIALRYCQLKHYNDYFHTVRVTDEVETNGKE